MQVSISTIKFHNNFKWLNKDMECKIYVWVSEMSEGQLLTPELFCVPFRFL